MSRAYKRHYLMVLYACTRRVAEQIYGERPVRVTFTAYDWTSWYHNTVVMRDGREYEIHFPRSVFSRFESRLNLGADEDE